MTLYEGRTTGLYALAPCNPTNHTISTWDGRVVKCMLVHAGAALSGMHCIAYTNAMSHSCKRRTLMMMCAWRVASSEMCQAGGVMWAVSELHAQTGASSLMHTRCD